MKQKFSRALFLGMMFFLGALFLFSVKQVSADMITGTNCTGSNGYQGTCIATNGDCSGARTKNPSLDCGGTADFTCCTNEPPSVGGGGSTPSTGGTVSGSVTPTSGACYDDFGTVVPCTYNPATGQPLSGNAGGVSAPNGGVSPTPPPATNPPAGGVAATGSNRLPASGPAGGASASGLYIPRGSEIGLSEMKVSDLIQNFMLWLLYIVGFVAIIAFVISGLQYLLAAGNEKMAEKAKANMQYAMIGVVVALSALIIIRAIQGVLSGAWIF